MSHSTFFPFEVLSHSAYFLLTFCPSTFFTVGVFFFNILSVNRLIYCIFLCAYIWLYIMAPVWARVSHIRFFQIFAMKRIGANWSLIRWIFALICEYSYKNIRFNSLSFAKKYSLRNKSTSKKRNIRFNSLQNIRFEHKANLKDEIFASIRFDSLQNIRFQRSCVPVHINAACPCPQCMDVYAVRPHVHSACPYCMSMSILHFHVFATCPCPWCMSRSMLQIHVHAAVHVHAASPCPCYQSMSMLYVHVLAIGT